MRVNDTPPVGKSTKHSPMGGTGPLAAGQHVGNYDLSGDEGNMGRLPRPEEEVPVAVSVGCRSSKVLASPCFACL